MIKLNKVDDKTAYENLLVKYAELENKIADIKANCDLAIEGRDVKIMELEKENEEMKKGLGCETCQIHLEYKRLNDKINDLEKEILLLHEMNKKRLDLQKGKYKTAYIKGIRTMANALKDYDRADGAWTDYFEHKVNEVLRKLLGEIEK